MHPVSDRVTQTQEENPDIELDFKRNNYFSFLGSVYLYIADTQHHYYLDSRKICFFKHWSQSQAPSSSPHSTEFYVGTLVSSLSGWAMGPLAKKTIN